MVGALSLRSRGPQPGSLWPRRADREIGSAQRAYKALELDGFRHADLYQLLAYTVAADLPGGLLIYAAGEGQPGRHQVRHINSTLKVRWLNLTGSPDEILAEVAEFACEGRP